MGKDNKKFINTAAGVLTLSLLTVGLASFAMETREDGKELYAKHCESCHGKSGKGDGPAAQGLEREPGNLADPLIARKSDEVLFLQISKGKKPMPAFENKLSAEERRLLVRYVRSLAEIK